VVPALSLTGALKDAVCQPELVSPEKVARASRLPVLLHRLPVCVPLFSAVL
jgi:hypothetical protein